MALLATSHCYKLLNSWARGPEKPALVLVTTLLSADEVKDGGIWAALISDVSLLVSEWVGARKQDCPVLSFHYKDTLSVTLVVGVRGFKDGNACKVVENMCAEFLQGAPGRRSLLDWFRVAEILPYYPEQISIHKNSKGVQREVVAQSHDVLSGKSTTAVSEKTTNAHRSSHSDLSHGRTAPSKITSVLQNLKDVDASGDLVPLQQSSSLRDSIGVDTVPDGAVSRNTHHARTTHANVSPEGSHVQWTSTEMPCIQITEEKQPKDASTDKISTIFSSMAQKSTDYDSLEQEENKQTMPKRGWGYLKGITVFARKAKEQAEIHPDDAVKWWGSSKMRFH